MKVSFTQSHGRQQAWAQQLEKLLKADDLLDQRQCLRAHYSPQLSYGRHFSPPGPFAKPAAVMVLLHLSDACNNWREATIPLTVRPDHLPDHPGQISFPGGRLETGESYLRAAKREFEEELGLAEFAGEVLGPLLPIWVFNSDFELQPFLAVHYGELTFQPCQREVSRIIQFPVQNLLSTVDNQSSQFSRGSIDWQANVFPHFDDLVWGATAIVLGDLAALLRRLDRQTR